MVQGLTRKAVMTPQNIEWVVNGVDPDVGTAVEFAPSGSMFDCAPSQEALNPRVET